MTIKKGKSTPINYADTTRDLIEKMLIGYKRDFGGEVWESQNKPNDLMILSTLVGLKKRLETLSKKARAGIILSKAFEKHNRAETEFVKEREDFCERNYNEACSIFHEAADAGIKLSSVPAVNGSRWSLMALRNWRKESSSKISKLLKKYILKITRSGKEKATQKIKGENWHNKDFTEVVWDGQKYTFNKTQSLVVSYLWDNQRASEKTIGEQLESQNENYRLRHTFREKKKGKIKIHLAWGKMIVPDGKGIYALNKKTKNPPKK
jgi:hypothetical protein